MYFRFIVFEQGVGWIGLDWIGLDKFRLGWFNT